jgi:hypothetical protein
VFEFVSVCVKSTADDPENDCQFLVSVLVVIWHNCNSKSKN